jgi:hypothetical protein
VHLRRRIAVAALAALVVAPAGSPAAGGRPVTIDAYGFWSLRRLGYGDIVLRENPRTAKTQAALTFRLPPGAKEGPGHWYIIRLHFRAEVRPNALAGEFNVAADTNDRTCASIIFDVTRRGNRPYVASDALGLVNGVERVRGPALVREIHFSNFLVIPGVRPGLNLLTLDLTSNAVPMVRSVRVYADSGIELTRAGPPSAAVKAHIAETHVRAGRTFHLQVELDHLAGIAVPRTVVRVQTAPGAVAGATVRTLKWGSTRPLRTTFVLRALQPGRVPISVQANVGTGSPSHEIVLYVTPRSG